MLSGSETLTRMAAFLTSKIFADILISRNVPCSRLVAWAKLEVWMNAGLRLNQSFLEILFLSFRVEVDSPRSLSLNFESPMTLRPTVEVAQVGSKAPMLRSLTFS